MKHIIFVLTAALMTSTAFAQTATPPPPQPRFTTDVTVTPERGETPRALVPAATVVLDRSAIDDRPITHPGELAGFLPGFAARRPEFHAGRPIVSARGFFGGGEAEYVLLLVDGVPVGDVESGLIDWAAVPASAIQRVEALRGPGASLYGDAAIGGVIQILTNRVGSGGHATFSGGSFGTFLADGSHRQRIGTTHLGLSGALRRTDGAFEHSEARQALGAVALDGRVKALSWRWHLTGDDRRRDDPGSVLREAFTRDPNSSDPLHRFDTVERNGLSTSVTLRHDSSFKPQARFHASARDEDLIRTILLFPGFGDRRARELSASTIGGTFDAERALPVARPAVLRFGLDLTREHLDTRYRSVDDAGVIGAANSSATGRRLRSGVFVSSLIDLAPRVRLSAALRWDGVNDSGFGGGTAEDSRAWSPRAGLVYQLNETGTMSLFAQASRAFKAPTLDQRFDPRPYPDFQGGTFTISNRNLVPQRATNLEAGVSGSGAVRWSALLYRMAVDDEIDFDVRTFSYANIGESRHTGVELELEGQRGRVRPFVEYALSRVIAEGTDLQLKNVPRHLFRIGATADLPGRVTAYLRFTRTTGAALDDEGAFPIDGPATIDVRLRRAFGRVSVFLDSMNAGGDRYEEFGFTLADFTGRTVPYVYPGAPRAVRAGLTVTY